jgi:hypothetical protein
MRSMRSIRGGFILSRMSARDTNILRRSRSISELLVTLQAFQREQEALSRNSKRVIIQGAGHGSLLFVKDHAKKTAGIVLSDAKFRMHVCVKSLLHAYVNT